MRITAKKFAELGSGVKVKRSRAEILREHEALVNSGTDYLETQKLEYIHSDASRVRTFTGKIKKRGAVKPGTPDLIVFIPPVGLARGLDAKTGEHGRATDDQLTQWPKLRAQGVEVAMYHDLNELAALIRRWRKQADEIAAALQEVLPKF